MKKSASHIQAGAYCPPFGFCPFSDPEPLHQFFFIHASIQRRRGHYLPTKGRQGPVFYQGAFRKTWISACIKCGLGHWEIAGKRKRYRGLIVHDFRRSAIRNMTLAGVPQNVIMGISGHKTTSVFLRYNIVAPGQLHTAMEAVQLWKQKEQKEEFDESLMKVEGLMQEPKQLSD